MYCGRDWPFITVGENPTLTWDFTPDIAPGDTIISATTTCIDMNNIDSDAAARLATAPEQQGLLILQPTTPFQTAGARYRITFSANTPLREVSWYSYLQVFAPGT